MAGLTGVANGRTAAAARPPTKPGEGGGGSTRTRGESAVRDASSAARTGPPADSRAAASTRPRRGRLLLATSVRGKLVASFSLLAVLVVATVLAGVAVAGSARTGALEARRNVAATRVVKQLQLDATAVAVAENSVAFDYASHSDPSGDLASFAASAHAFSSDTSQAARLGLDGAERADLAKATAAFGRYRALSVQINHDDAVGTKASLADASRKVAALSFATITTPLEALVSKVADGVNASTSAALSSAGSDQALLLGLGLFVVLLALASAIVIVRAVARPIATLSATLGAVAGGDLSARAEVASHDELGRLAEDLNTAIAAQEEARHAIDRQAGDQAAMSSANAGVLEILGALRAAHSIDDAVRVALETICGALDWAYGSYFALEPGGRALSFRAEAGPLAGGELSSRSRNASISVGSDLDGRAVAARGVVASGRLEELVDSPRAQAARGLGVTSAGAFPVVAGGEVVGTMSFFAAPGGPALTPWREKALADAGHVVSSALERIADQVREREGEAALREKVDQILDVVSAAASGDLTVVVPVAGEDAIGRVGTSLAGFLMDLRERMRAIGENTSGLAAAIEELSGRTAEGTVTSAVRAGTVETVAAAAEELTSSIQEIASAAADAARVALEGAAAAESTSATVQRLSDSSAEIGQVIKTITSIAEQTNMLALNATIEAARAGEAGKGFAVVASEVKDLAQGTTAAADDVAERIQAIQVDAERTVAAVTAIKDVVDRVNALQGSIASAVEEQTATTNEIARSMSGAADAAGDIGRMTLELESLIARFSC